MPAANTAVASMNITAADTIINQSQARPYTTAKEGLKMKEITAFYLNGCPYCRGAKEALAELVSENPAYGEVPVHWYEESESPDVVQGHSYYYVPSMFIGTEKLYEAQPGQSYDEIKSHVKAALDAAMA